jgi:hypothetical protein
MMAPLATCPSSAPRYHFPPLYGSTDNLAHGKVKSGDLGAHEGACDVLIPGGINFMH